MVKITKFDTSLSGSFNCNSLSIKNCGTSEANVTFDSSSSTLSIARGQIIYVFNSDKIVSDTYNVVFTGINTTNELEVIETTYPDPCCDDCVLSVTGLDTDNTDPQNPIVKISVDNVTITGDGTPLNPLVSSASLPQDLENVLMTGNSAGTYDVDMNNNDILNADYVNAKYVSSVSGGTDLALESSLNILFDPTGYVDCNNKDVLNIDKAGFNLATTDTAGEGELVWNSDDGTLNLGLKGGNVTLQVGEENVIRIINKTSPPITLFENKYQAVIVTTAVAGKLAVKLAQANSDISSFTTIGIVTEDILFNTEGFITAFGLVRNINTTGSMQGETWNDGDVLYLSPTIAGGITNIQPISPNNIITIGYVAKKDLTTGSIFVKVDNLGYISSGNNFIIESSTQWSRTLALPVALPNGSVANGFTFFSDLTDRVASGCTSYNEFFISFGRTLTLTGVSGSANINIGGIDYLATFNTSLTQTATDFVTTHQAAILAASGVQVFANSGVLRFGYITAAVLNAISITNVVPNLSGVFDAAIGNHVVVPYTTEPYNGLRITHQFRVNFNIDTGSEQTLALSLRRWSNDSIIGSEIPVQRTNDVSGQQENFISYTAGPSDPFVTGGFYFALRNDSGVSVDISGTVGILVINTFQKPVNF